MCSAFGGEVIKGAEQNVGKRKKNFNFKKNKNFKQF